MSLCREPGFWDASKDSSIWDCAEDSRTVESMTRADDCIQGQPQVWVYIKGQPITRFPSGVGFDVGLDVGLGFVVFGAHHIQQETEFVDDVSITLTFAEREKREDVESAHTLVFQTYDWIPGRSRKSIESSYLVTEEVTLFPLMYLLHNHQTGAESGIWVVSPYSEWTLIAHQVKGEANATIAMSMHPVLHPERQIVRGDRIAIQCLLSNDDEKPVMVRATGDHMDMCYVLLTYYSKSGEKLELDVVLNDGVSSEKHGYSWYDDPVLRPRHQESRKIRRSG
jgi:hypothetical protein